MPITKEAFQELLEAVDAAITIVNPLLDGFQLTQDLAGLFTGLTKIPNAYQGIGEVDDALDAITPEQYAQVDQLVDSRITTIVKDAAYQKWRPKIVNATLAIAAVIVGVASGALTRAKK